MEKKNAFTELYTNREILTNSLNAKRQDMMQRLVDMKLLERIRDEKGEHYEVANDHGQPISVTRRIEEVKIGLINSRRRVFVLTSMLEQNDAAIDAMLTDEALAPKHVEAPAPEATDDLEGSDAGDEEAPGVDNAEVV